MVGKSRRKRWGVQDVVAGVYAGVAYRVLLPQQERLREFVWAYLSPGLYPTRCKSR